MHQLIRDGNATHDPVDVNDTEIAGYVARLAEYQAAYAAGMAAQTLSKSSWFRTPRMLQRNTTADRAQYIGFTERR